MNFEEISFGIISKVGEGKYKATEAFKNALSNNYKDAYKLIEEANTLVNEAGSLHMDVIQKEAEGNNIKFSVLFMHAEDQFLTTQTFILTTKMMIQILEKNNEKKK